MKIKREVILIKRQRNRKNGTKNKTRTKEMQKWKKDHLTNLVAVEDLTTETIS